MIASQNTESNSNRTRVLQKNSLPSDVLQNITALNIIFPALKSGDDNNGTHRYYSIPINDRSQLTTATENNSTSEHSIN
jgi:hypothetical protein